MSFLPEGYTKAKSSPTLRPKPGRKGSGRVRVDWDKYPYRCSMLPKLMVKTKEYSDLLYQLFNQEVNGFEIVVETEAMLFGTEHEQESIDLINKVRGTQYTKVLRGRKNAYIQGTPDIKTPTCIIDIKTVQSNTFKNLTRAIALKKYKWQLVGYCWLYGINEAEIIFVDLTTVKIKSVKFTVTAEDIQELQEAVEKWRKLCWTWWKQHINSPWEIPF